MTTEKVDIVITYFGEDLSWITSLNHTAINEIIIYNKLDDTKYIPLPNIGLDTHTILHHIVNNYNDFNPTIFLQGNPFDSGIKPSNVSDIHKMIDELQDGGHTLNYHISPVDSSLINGMISNWKNRELTPVGTDIKSWCESIGLGVLDNLPIYWGCQFGINDIILYNRDIDFYKELLELHKTKYTELSHFLERTWGAIFNIYPSILNNRNNLGNYLSSLGLNGKGVEVGAFKGEFSKQLLENWKGTLYMIDPWRVLDTNEYDNFYNQNNTYQDTTENIKGFENRAFMLRGLSNDLVELFEDNSLDFVYIDANHAYDYVKEDIDIWYPKIKKNGVISGYGYCMFNNKKVGWYEDSTFAEDKVNKHIWDNEEKIYLGLFGVNPAIDKFSLNNSYEIKVTDEWYSTWYFIKK